MKELSVSVRLYDNHNQTNLSLSEDISISDSLDYDQLGEILKGFHRIVKAYQPERTASDDDPRS